MTSSYKRSKEEGDKLSQHVPSLAHVFVMVFALSVLFLLLYFTVARPTFKGIDKICVAGRISGEQADAVNSLQWQKYNQIGAGPGDRIVKKECSELLKLVTQGK